MRYCNYPIAVLGYSELIGTRFRQIHGRSIQVFATKLMFLYSFANVVTYPETAFESAKSPLVIGSVGKGPVGTNLNWLAKASTAQGRRIKVLRFTPVNNLSGYQILFLSRSVSQVEVQVMISASQDPDTLAHRRQKGFAI